jgi:hypothetical protein
MYDYVIYFVHIVRVYQRRLIYTERKALGHLWHINLKLKDTYVGGGVSATLG